MVLETEPGALNMVGKHSTAELYLYPGAEQSKVALDKLSMLVVCRHLRHTETVFYLWQLLSTCGRICGSRYLADP